MIGESSPEVPWPANALAICYRRQMHDSIHAHIDRQHAGRWKPGQSFRAGGKVLRARIMTPFKASIEG